MPIEKLPLLRICLGYYPNPKRVRVRKALR